MPWQIDLSLKTDDIIFRGNEWKYLTEVVKLGLTKCCTALHLKFDKYKILCCLEHKYQAGLIAKCFYASDFFGLYC